MPDAETQTEDFILLSKEQIKKLTIPERKIYKLELKEYKKEKTVERHRNYCREYMRTYGRNKYKYDPVYRQKQIEKVKFYQQQKKLKKQLEKVENLRFSSIPNQENSITQQQEQLPADAETSIIDSFRLLLI
jgi:hypothetical protein